MNKYELALETLKSEHKKFTIETATSLFGISIDTIIEACEKADKFDLIQEKLTDRHLSMDEEVEEWNEFYIKEATAKIAHDEILELTKTNNELRKELESYKRKSNIGKKVFSIVMYLNSMIREYPHCRIECIKWELFAITVCDGKTAEEIEKKQDEKNNFNFILARPDWFITVK